MSRAASGERTRCVNEATSVDFVRVSPEVINPIEWYDHACRPEAGGIVQFCGTVRDHNQGARVLALSYEAFTEMAEAEIHKIIDVARQRWPLLHASAVHRTGELQIGDVAVCVTVASAHRDAAFAACRFVIDELKSTAPIWKKETLESGERRWVEESTPGPGSHGRD
jgi:molybdopterin synthase catalytic subunit